MKIEEYASLDAVALAQLLREKEVTTEALIELSLERLEAVNPHINAATYTRKEAALQEAGRAPSDLFAGIPTFLKDISQTIKGEPNTAGSKLLAHERSSQTANFVKKMYGAGLISVGNSATPEFALKNITEAKLHGPTRNPWNLAYSPGGSSGGAAALVAAGVVPIAGASDGGGSIRIPASFTNLVGLKPTRGRTAVGPGVGRNWHGAAIDFVLTKSVRDTARSLDGLQVLQAAAAFQVPLYEGTYELAMKEGVKKGLRIGFTSSSPVATPVSEDAKQAVIKTVAWLESQGHHVEEVDHQVDGEQLMREYYIMNSGEMSQVLRQLSRQFGRQLTADDVEIETWLLSRAGEAVSAADFTESLASWDQAAEKMARFHETYDFFITPATAYPAPKIGELTHSKAKEMELREEVERLDAAGKQDLIYQMFLPSLTYTPFTQLANLTGQPAISLPVHKTETGLPLGVQIMANKGREDHLLAIAYLIENSPIWEGMGDTVLSIE